MEVQIWQLNFYTENNWFAYNIIYSVNRCNCHPCMDHIETNIMYTLLGAKALQMLSSTMLGVTASQIQHTCTGSEDTLAECHRSWLQPPTRDSCESLALLACASE